MAEKKTTSKATRSRKPKADTAEQAEQKRATAAETVARHNEVIRLRLRGLTWAQIVEKTGLGDSAARAAWYAWTADEKVALVSEDPLDVVMEQIAGFRELRSMAANVYEESEGVLVEESKGGKLVMIGKSPTARIGALRLMMDLRAREIDLRQETGLLPRNLGKFQVEIDVRYVVDQLVQIMVKYDMPPAAQDEMLQLLEREPEQPSIAAASAAA